LAKYFWPCLIEFILDGENMNWKLRTIRLGRNLDVQMHQREGRTD
jgi:hypothetical protein